MKRFLALLAFLAVAGFITVLIIEVPSPDLIIVSLLTIVLVAYDFVSSSGKRRE